MKTEFEAKYYPINKKELIEKLKVMGAELQKPERKMRRIIFGREKNSGMQVHYIRVRDEGDLVRLSAKTHATRSGELHDQKESEAIVTDFDNTVEILRLSGLRQTGYQENYRETWKYKKCSIEIDTWPGLKTYVEVEGNSEESVKQIFEYLDLNWEKRIITSNVEIYVDEYKVSPVEVHKALENCTFENPPFS